jgi:ribosomal protein S18 acetylase RimI-like enzyme
MTHHLNQTSAIIQPIALRPVTPADGSFLLEIYASTRADEMALLPWPDEQKQAFVLAQFNAQRQHYQQTYPEANHDVILFNGRLVGRLYIARLETEIRIVDITLHPRDRNRGIGSNLLRSLLGEASDCGKLLRIYVESFNPSLRLFERLGFSRSEEQGIHVLMEWSPGTGQPGDEMR